MSVKIVVTFYGSRSAYAGNHKFSFKKKKFELSLSDVPTAALLLFLSGRNKFSVSFTSSSLEAIL